MKALLLLAVSWAAAAQTPIEARTIWSSATVSARHMVFNATRVGSRCSKRASRALAPPHQVVNASISGDTTGGALARLPRALEIHKPDLVVIEVGGNDALRGYPIDTHRTAISTRW